MTEKKRNPAPECTTYEEEAAFWDNHDVTEHWDDFKPVKVRFARNLSEGIHVRLDKKTLDSLKAEAQEKGIGPTTLARMWILEHLQSREERLRP